MRERRWGGCRSVDRRGLPWLYIQVSLILQRKGAPGGGGVVFQHTHGRGSGMGFIAEDLDPGVGAGWAAALGRQGAVGRCVFPDPESLTRGVDGGEMDRGGGMSGDQSNWTRGHREGRGFVVRCGGSCGQEGESSEDEGSGELHVDWSFVFLEFVSLKRFENGENEES